MTEITIEEQVWLAAMIDAEGWIGVSKVKNGISCRLGVTNTSNAILEKFADICEKITGNRQKFILHSGESFGTKSRIKKLCRRYIIHKQRDIIVILIKVNPYLVEKQGRSKIMLNYLMSREPYDRSVDLTKEKEVIESIQKLNREGEHTTLLEGGD